MSRALPPIADSKIDDVIVGTLLSIVSKPGGVEKALIRAVPSDEFIHWANGAGIDFDPRYPDSGCLSLIPLCQHGRFWVLPGDAYAWPHFVGTMLEGLDEWSAGYLWPRARSWPRSDRAQSYADGVRDTVLRGAGIPDGWSGAISFDRVEEDKLIAVLFAYLAFGGCVDDDLFFIPDHGRQLLQSDHHDVIHIKCKTEERIQKLVAHMAAADYELPSELPDETFKRPAWMGNDA